MDTKFRLCCSDEQKVILEQFINNVNNELVNVKKSFIKIGYYLSQAKYVGYWNYLGFKNFEEMAENLFGFKKSTAYGLCHVWELFHDYDCKDVLHKDFEHLNYSQLLEISKTNFCFRNLCKIVKSDDSVSDVKKLVKFWNSFTKNTTEIPKGESIKEIFENYNVDSLNVESANKILDNTKELPEEVYSTPVKIDNGNVEEIDLVKVNKPNYTLDFKEHTALFNELVNYMYDRLPYILGSFKLVFDIKGTFEKLPKQYVLKDIDYLINLITGQNGLLADFFTCKVLNEKN